MLCPDRHRIRPGYDFTTGQEVDQNVEEEIQSEDLPVLGINIQGDGANISSETSQVQFVFLILNEGMDVLKPANHHCFAIMVSAILRSTE
jgi:hypothetical protein